MHSEARIRGIWSPMEHEKALRQSEDLPDPYGPSDNLSFSEYFTVFRLHQCLIYPGIRVSYLEQYILSQGPTYSQF